MRKGVVVPPGWDGRIALVGEAWGQQEEKKELPFQGASGQELTRMLADAGLDRRDILITNVFCERPPGNDLGYWCCKKKELPSDTPERFQVPIKNGEYLKPEYWDQVYALDEEVSGANLVIACGNTAIWALTQSKPSVGKMRGALSQTASGQKMLPTYHPAAVIRDWSLRAVTVMDFIKARGEQSTDTIQTAPRNILIQPTLEEIREFFSIRITPGVVTACDIETTLLPRFFDTWPMFINCIGFAPTPDQAIVIPFLYKRTATGKFNQAYWKSFEEEFEVWEIIRAALENPEIGIIFQNGMFDAQVLYRFYQIRTRAFLYDTMLRHHAMYPELPKALGFPVTINGLICSSVIFLLGASLSTHPFPGAFISVN